MNKKVSIVLLIAFVMILSACGTKVSIDYGDAESFEAALNAGENLEGKVVQFVAGELHPDSISGYDIWAGEHLNFISSRHPSVKEGDVVVVRATEINSALGSWLINYEKVDNAVVAESTIFSGSSSTEASAEGGGDNSTSGNTGSMNSGKGDISTISGTATDSPKDVEITYEAVDSDMVGYKDYFGPKVSAYVAIKNTSEVPIKADSVTFDYEDESGKLLTTDSYVHCIPEVIKPGQIGYMYSYHLDVSNVDLSNGFVPNPQGRFVAADNYYEIEVSDVSASEYLGSMVKVIGRGTNSTDKDHSVAEPGAVMFNADGKVIGFCWTMESFGAGQTKTFEMSGDLMSDSYSPSDVDHVEVYIQCDEWY